MSPRCVSNVAGCTDLRKNMPPKFSRGYHSNDKIFSLGRTSAAPRPRRPLATSALALLAPLPIPSNALFCNFYILFHTRCSIFRDFQHTPPVLGPEFLGKKRVSRTGGFSRLPIRDLGDPAAWNRLKIVDSSEELCIPTFQSTAPSTKGMQSRSL